MIGKALRRITGAMKRADWPSMRRRRTGCGSIPAPAVRILLWGRVDPSDHGGIERFLRDLLHGAGEARGLITLSRCRSISRPSPLGAIVEFGRLVSESRRHHVLHLSGASAWAMAAALVSRRPFVIEHHGFQTVCPNGQMFHAPSSRPCVGYFQRREFRECQRCLSDLGISRPVTAILQTVVKSALASRAARHVTPTAWAAKVIGLAEAAVVPHGIELRERWDRAGSFGAERSQPDDVVGVQEFRVAFIGRLVSTKGVETLVRAVSEVRAMFPPLDAHLTLIGDGPERKHLEELTGELGLRGVVRFLGRLDDVDAAAELNASHVSVVPSLGGEVFGYAALEHMSLGLPVIVSELGALLEVCGGCAYTFPPGDVEALAQRVRDVAKDYDKALRRASEGRKRAASFSIQSMVRAHFDLYDEVLSGADWRR